MPRLLSDPVDLHGLVLPDARGGPVVDLGTVRGPAVVVAIRHRY
jgi:hypothetical protein